MRQIVTSVGLACTFLFLLILALSVQAGPTMPSGAHCGDVGPLPDDPSYCGCTWGEVLFRGQVVPGAAVTITFRGSAVTDFTRITSLESFPYFDLSAHNLGARKGDLLTLTAQFAGQAVSRTIRAWPDSGGEQHVVLAFPERGIWSSWVTGGYTHALALAGNEVWAGGPAGLISVSLTSGISVVHTLPWVNPSVRALAVGMDGHVWAAGSGGVAEFDGTAWHTHTLPFTGTVRALAMDPVTGATWLGSDDGTHGQVAVYTGTWKTAGTFGAAVMALAVDSTGRAWAGTWGEGVYRQNGSGSWDHYQTVDGLASDYVLAAATTGDAAWFGTEPYLSTDGLHGGIARYDLTAGAWRTYTTVHGLPADAAFSQAPASVYALARTQDGVVWAGVADGVRFLADSNWWAAYTTTHGLRPGIVRALAVGNGTAVAAVPAGLDRLDPNAPSGEIPLAQINTVAPLTLTFGTTLTLSGTGQDSDEAGQRIVAWDWSSSLDGPLCTTASCALPHSLLSPGIHSIALRVQDDEGYWSNPVTATVVVRRTWRLYLPSIIK
jgi:hypothetical protein